MLFKCCLFALLTISLTTFAADKLVVHEWGTFTSFQNEAGASIRGINTDDEPVPKFVHNIANHLLLTPSEVPPIFFQGAPSCHPDVTMRLETPVLYFHAGKDFRGKVDVKVEFKGGWLTQFYPDAVAVAPGVKDGSFGPLNDSVVGSLEWRNLELNAAGNVPETESRVWLAPRAVDALPVKTEKGESEKYLFYRGVGNLDAPVRVVRKEGQLEIEALKGAKIGTYWLADIRADGSAAFIPAQTNSGAVKLPAEFAPSSYSKDAIGKLRAQLRSALISDGLFADEAEALLNTWEVSYFKSAGTRLFFLVPRDWTDRVMPLSISGQSTEVTRVMVGRVELVTPAQRALLKTIAAGPVPDGWKDFREPMEKKLLRLSPEGVPPQGWNDVFNGTKRFDEVGFEPPALYRAYLNLGRFRNALILDEQKSRPDANIAKFIEAFGLKGYDN